MPIDNLLTPTNLFLVLVATTAVLSIAVEWRITLFTLLVQYLAVGVLLARFATIQVAAVEVLVGALTCAILAVTARAAEQNLTGDGFLADSTHRALVWSPSINDL